MKKIIAAMLLSIGCASGEDKEPTLWAAVLPNDLKVIFTDKECPVKHLIGKQVAAKLKDDSLAFGCWHEYGAQVVVFWVVDSERDIIKIVEWDKSDIRFMNEGPWEGYIKYGTTQI